MLVFADTGWPEKNKSLKALTRWLKSQGETELLFILKNYFKELLALKTLIFFSPFFYVMSLAYVKTKLGQKIKRKL